MAKQLTSTWDLTSTPLEREDFIRAFQDFEYYTSHCQQIVDKRRRLVYMRLNAFQKYMFGKLLALLEPESRLDKRHDIVLLKPRQCGMTVGMISFINWFLSCVEGIENFNFIHILPATDTISKLYSQKVAPIITGVHPDIMATVEKMPAMTSSIRLYYKDILGVRRNNYYDLVSANASSLRSGTANAILYDECLSPNVEVLTDKGFKRLDQLDKTEKVAQFDCSTEGVSFVKPIRYIDRPYNGDAYKWTLGGETFYSTSRHDFVVGRRGSGRSMRPKYSKRPAYSVAIDGKYDVPVWGLGKTWHESLSALERLGIATQADGTVLGIAKRKGRAVTETGDTRCVMSLKRTSKINRMRRLLEEASVDYSENPQDDGKTTFRYSLPYSNPKRLDTFLSEECSYQRAREIIHEVLMWDGYGLNRENSKDGAYLPKSSSYSSIVKENRDFVAAVAFQAGLKCTCGTQEDARSEAHKDVYRVSMTSRANMTYQAFTKEEVNYDGRVYCVTVPTGCIVVRVGGKIWVTGNCSFYRQPEQLEDAVSPMLPAYGFSLVIYASTFDDKQSDYFKKKIITARDNPEDWTLMFAPWFMVYPEEPQDVDLDSLELTEYDQQVIMPAMADFGLPRENWGDAIDWYHKTELRTSSMKKEYPTTLEEVLAIGENKSCFTKESLDKQEKNILPDHPYRLITDTLTGKSELQPTDESPIILYKKPVYGRRYMLVCDPISSNSDSSDYFAATVWDVEKNEQMLNIYTRGMMIEDLADLVKGVSDIYNRAIVCPESNMSEGLQASLRAKGFYNFYYQNEQRRARKEAGIRTTVASKPAMLDKTQMMLNTSNLIIHSGETLRQLREYKKIVKNRSGGSATVGFSAPKGDHDDLVSCVFLYAGTRSDKELAGKRSQGFTIL